MERPAAADVGGTALHVAEQPAAVQPVRIYLLSGCAAVSDEDRRSGGGGGGALLLVLVVVGAVAKYAIWIAAFFGAVLVFGGIISWSFYLARRDDQRRAARDEIVARADEQHRLVLAGDDRGMYGEWPPARMP